MKRFVAVAVLVSLFTAPAAALAQEKIVIKAGTEVLLKTIDKINSKKVKAGQVFQFLAEKSVKDNKGNVLIEQGASAYGTVEEASSAGMVGTAGKLGLKFNSVKAFNDVDVPLSGTNETEGASNTGAAAGAAFIGTFVFFWPLLPAAFFFRGANAVVPSGTILRAYVAKDTVLVPGDPQTEAAELAQKEFERKTRVDEKLNKLLQEYDEREKAQPPAEQSSSQQE